MATKVEQHKYLMSERSMYVCADHGRKGWDSMTQVNLYDSMFDGKQARPYVSQLAGTPRARARSGPRSVNSWQRDYNTRGLIDEKPRSNRQERVLKVKAQAEKEASNRGLSTREVEKEIYEAQREGMRRTDTGLRKNSHKSRMRAVELDEGSETRIFDGSEELESDFSLKDARAMFRGEDWQLMSEALNNLDPFGPRSKADGTVMTVMAAAKFKPGARTSKSQTGARGSFSVGVTPAELSKALATGVGGRGANTPSTRGAAAAASEVAELKKLLIRKYGSITAGYRHAMAPDGNGRLAFTDFGKGLRTAGFQGNAKGMFQYMDADGDGILTFAEFEPELGPTIKKFRSALFATYGGTYDTMWAAIDVNGNNTLDVDEFEEVCVNVGMEDLSQELFREFREHPSRKFLTLTDIKSIPRGY